MINPNPNIIKIEKLINGGQALGTTRDGRKAFVWNALPGETVVIQITKNKKNYIEGVAEKIIIASPYRQPPAEDHFLSCSPWQILSYNEENNWKIKLGQELYQGIGKFTPNTLSIDSMPQEMGYRNKIEYNFWENDNHLNFAFHERGKKYRYAIDHCQLASPAINQTAKLILDWLNQTLSDKRLVKSLIVRSNLAGETIAALFIKQEYDFPIWPLLNENFIGFHVYLSDYRCPASRPDKLVFSQGQNFLTEKINNLSLRYGLLSFFQVNIPIFQKTLNDIEKRLIKNRAILDLYSGVGAISLPLNKHVKKLELVEINAEAIAYAKINIEKNKIKNAQTFLLPAEKSLELITEEKTIIVDPPRAGLHPAVIEKLLLEKPQQIIYLSCDLATQARDLNLLLPDYKIDFQKLYNYFPRTPHIEGLTILNLK